MSRETVADVSVEADQGAVERSGAPLRERGARRPAARVLRGLVVIFVAFVGFIAVLYAFQANLIFPGAATQGRAEAVARVGPGEELVRLATDKGEVVAIYGGALDADGQPLADAASRPALVFFYGNAMCAAYCAPILQQFRRLGLNVMIPDYLGYGMSGGEPSEVGCRATAEACYHNLRERGFPADRIIAGGWSLGAAVAIDLASRKPVAGLIALSAFTNVRDMARRLIPIPLPPALFAHKFDNLSKISGIKCPILLGHGRRDSIIPFAMFERLSAAVKAPLSKVVVDEADHNDFFERGEKRINAAILELVVRGVAPRDGDAPNQ